MIANIIFMIAETVLLIVMTVSAYKVFRRRNNFARITFWISAAALAALLALDVAVPPETAPPTSPVQINEHALSAAFDDAKFELLKFEEIDSVTISLDRTTAELTIKLTVNDGVDEAFLHEIQDESVRIFLRAMVDNCEIPSLIGGRSLLSRLRIAVVLVRSNNEQALPSREGFFSLAGASGGRCSCFSKFSAVG